MGFLTLFNLVLSYWNLPAFWQTLLFVLGILFPSVLWFQKGRKYGTETRPLWRTDEFFPSIPPALWLFLALAAIALRFWKIDSLFLWPTGDEGLKGTAAIGLSRQWDWRFFYTVGQNPPAFIWLCALFFKTIRSSLFDLWAPAALVSFLTVVLGAAAVGKYASRSFTLLFASLLAFSYWPLYIGRRCLPAITVPLGLLLLVFCLAGFLRSGGERKQRWAFLAGLVAGLQSFTYVSWPVVSLAGGLAFLKGAWDLKRDRAKAVVTFVLGAALALVPFGYAVFTEGYGQHISNLTPWSGWFHDHNPLFNIPLYLRALFWDFSDNPQAPPQGGLLNPLLASFFFLGCVELVRFRKAAWARGCAVAFALFLLPGIFSLNLQPFRVIQLLPLVLAVAALGVARFIPALPRPRRGWILGGLLLVSAAWDMGRLALPYSDVDHHPQWFLSTEKSLARYRAYVMLKQLEEREGPGFILGEWDVPSDRTLYAATYFSNCVVQPPLDGFHPKWLAVMADSRYRPFLAQRFPDAQWIRLDADFSADGTRMMGILPITSENRKDLLTWILADRALGDLNHGIDHVYDKDCLDWMDEKIREDYPLVQGDRFLESVFWEKAAYFYYYYGNHFAQHLGALQRAVQRGYPAAHLYTQLGELYTLAQQPERAKQAYAKAKESEARYPWR